MFTSINPICVHTAFEHERQQSMAIWQRGCLKNRLLNRLSEVGGGGTRETTEAKGQELTQIDPTVVGDVKNTVCMPLPWLPWPRCFIMGGVLQSKNGAGYRWHFLPDASVAPELFSEWDQPASINESSQTTTDAQAKQLSFWINHVVSAHENVPSMWDNHTNSDSFRVCMTDQSGWTRWGARSKVSSTAWQSTKKNDLKIPKTICQILNIFALLGWKNPLWATRNKGWGYHWIVTTAEFRHAFLGM